MRLLICVLLVANISVLSANAQISIACQGGMNIANLTDPGNLIAGGVWSTRIGFVGLVSANFPVGGGFSVNPGFRFVQKGTNSAWSHFSVGNVESRLTITYLELPVYVKYALINSQTRFSVLLGLSLGYLLSSQAKGTIQSQGPFTFDVKEDYKSIDFSLDAGLEFETPIDRTFSMIGAATYAFGLAKINRRGSNEQTRDIRVTIGAAYSFN